MSARLGRTALLALAGFGLVWPARAETIVVSTTDELRNAIDTANTSPGPTEIVLRSGTYRLQAEYGVLPMVTGDGTTIRGEPGAVIDGSEFEYERLVWDVVGGPTGLWIDASQILVTGVHLTNFAMGIRIQAWDELSDIAIVDNQIDGQTFGGIRATTHGQGALRNLRISDNELVGSIDDPEARLTEAIVVGVDGGFGTVIEELVIEDNTITHLTNTPNADGTEYGVPRGIVVSVIGWDPQNNHVTGTISDNYIADDGDLGGSPLGGSAISTWGEAFDFSMFLDPPLHNGDNVVDVTVTDNRIDDFAVGVEAVGGFYGQNSTLILHLTENQFANLSGPGLLVNNESSIDSTLVVTADDNKISAAQLDPLPWWLMGWPLPQPLPQEAYPGVLVMTQAWGSVGDQVTLELSDLEIEDYPVGAFIMEGCMLGCGGGPTQVDLADVRVEDAEIDLEVWRCEPSGLTVTVDGVVQ